MPFVLRSKKVMRLDNKCGCCFLSKSHQSNFVVLLLFLQLPGIHSDTNTDPNQTLWCHIWPLWIIKLTWATSLQPPLTLRLPHTTPKHFTLLKCVFVRRLTGVDPEISLNFDKWITRSRCLPNSPCACHVSALNGFLNSSLIPGLLVLQCVIKPYPLVVLFGVVPEEPQLPAVKHTALDFESSFFLCQEERLQFSRKRLPHPNWFIDLMEHIKFFEYLTHYV